MLDRNRWCYAQRCFVFNKTTRVSRRETTPRFTPKGNSVMSRRDTAFYKVTAFSMVKQVKTKPKKKKTIQQVSEGRVYIYSSYNNTIVTLTDNNGNVLASSSAGVNGFRGPKKATPYAASVIVRDLAAKAEPYGVRSVKVFVQGVGAGRESAVRSLNANGFAVQSIKDVTPLPHNGCRRPRPRRV